MRIEKLENGYKLTDLYIAATLLCQPNMELVCIENNKNDRHTMFVVKGDPIKIKQIIDDFFNGKHLVEPNAFKTKVQLLKSRLYANY